MTALLALLGLSAAVVLLSAVLAMLAGWPGAGIGLAALALGMVNTFLIAAHRDDCSTTDVTDEVEL